MIKQQLILLFFAPWPLFAQTQDPVAVSMDQASVKVITVGSRPDFLAAHGDYAWVIDDGNSRIKKLSIHSSTPILTVAIPDACAAPVVAFDAIWVVSCKERNIYRLSERTGKVSAKIATGIADDHGEMSLAAGDGSIWILSDSGGVLSRINPNSNLVQTTIKVRPHSYCAGYGYHAVWITNTNESTVQKVDVGTNTVIATIPVGKNPRFISVGDQGVWVLNQGDGTVTRIDPLTNKVLATIDVQAKGPGGDIAQGGNKIWIVSTNTRRPVQTIDARKNQIETIYSQKNSDGKITKADGAVRSSGKYVWVSGLYRQKVWVLLR